MQTCMCCTYVHIQCVCVGLSQGRDSGKQFGHKQAMQPVTVCDGHVVVPKCTGTEGQCKGRLGTGRPCTQSQCVMVMLLCPSAQAQRASAKEGWAQAGMHPVTVCDGHVVVPKCTGTDGQCKARLGTGRPCTQSQCVMVMLLCPSAQAQRASAKEGWAQAGHAPSHSV